MYKKNTAYKNKNLSLLLIFSILFLYIFKQNFVYSLAISVGVIYICICKIKYKKIAMFMCIGFIPLFLFLLIRDFNIFSYIGNKAITQKIDSFIIRNYNERTSAWILILCFGRKINNDSWDIYNKTSHLSMVYLMSIGGLQISFLKLFILKVIRHKKTSTIISLIVVVFYTYLLGFKSGILRVLLCLIVSLSLKRWIRNKYDILAFSGILTLFIQPSAAFDFGYSLSYICTYFVIWIYKSENISTMFKGLLINIGCTIITIPFVSKIDGSISLASILFAGGFTSIFIFAYIWYLFSFCIVFLRGVQNAISYSLSEIVNGVYEINIEIKISKLNDLFTSLFYTILFIVLSVLSIKYVNKNTSFNTK
ncbi:MAG: hypothetical protein Ta2E_02960 [Mycoplasmoidaceae bacterium]|nr:MAG: hypothetical protein Ta2E_02960 [Mycoplasmoidaceae bacterium]